MRKLVTFILVAFAAVFVLAACTEVQNQDKSRQEAVASRESNFDRAEAMWPAPTDLVNFPMREALVKFTQRQDEVNHPWYVYVMGESGEPIGYYVSQTYPINACNFLSDTTRFVDLADGQWGVTTAPSYDGVFYGNSRCDAYFFFDVETNAMHTFTLPFIASDRPYEVYTDVPQLSVSGEPMEDATPIATPEAGTATATP